MLEIRSEFIQACGDKLCEQVHKIIVLVCNKEGLSEEWKEFFIVAILEDDRMYNYREFSLLSTSYRSIKNDSICKLNYRRILMWV